MAKITPEMEALLDYAEAKGLCLYQIEFKDDPEFGDWEDMLWSPTELREALLDYPEQTRAGQVYPGHSYPDVDINDHLIWRIADPNDIFRLFSDKAKNLFEEARSQQDLAEYFKRLWIDRTEIPLWKRDD